jgi:hypothetical protein
MSTNNNGKRGPGRPPGRPSTAGKTIDTATIDQQPEILPGEGAAPGFFDVPDTRDPGTYHVDGDLRQWLAQARADDKSYTATLYRYDQNWRGKQYIVSQWKDELPTAHEMGLQFGPGEYRLVIQAGDDTSRLRAVRFNIGKEYEGHRAKLGLASLSAPSAGPQAAGPQGGAPGVDSALMLVKTVVEMLKPLIETRHAAAPDPAASLAGTYEMMNSVMRKSLMENVSFYRDMAGRLSAPALHDVDDEDEGEGEDQAQDQGGEGLPPWLSGLIETYLPLIMGKGPQAAAAVATLKALPQYKATVSDREKLAGLVAAVEGKIGAEETEKLLRRLKIARP